MSLAKDHLIVVQEDSLRTGALSAEWRLPRQHAGSVLADMKVDAAHSKALCIYQDGVATTVVIYRFR